MTESVSRTNRLPLELVAEEGRERIVLDLDKLPHGAVDIFVRFKGEDRGVVAFCSNEWNIGVQLWGPEGGARGCLWTDRKDSSRRTFRRKR